jgi:hypothetical protein
MKYVRQVVGWAVLLVLVALYVAVFGPALPVLLERLTERWSERVVAYGLFLPLVFLFPCYLAWFIARRARAWLRLAVIGILVILAVIANWMLTTRTDENPLAFITILVALAFGMIAALWSIHRALARRDPTGWIRVGILIALALPLILLSIDAPPPANVCKPRDLVATWPGAAESQKVLLTFPKGGHKMAVSTQSVDLVDRVSNLALRQTNVLAVAQEIEQAWQEVAEGRAVIDKLSTFDRIADMTDPAWLDISNTNDVKTMGFVSYRTLARTYCAYAELKAAQGRHEDAARELVKLQSVAGKAHRDMVILVSKMIWVAIAGRNIEQAYRVASDPACSRDALELLKAGFQPLDDQFVSMRGTAQAEMLAVLYGVPAMIAQGRTVAMLSASGQQSAVDTWVARPLTVLHPLFYHPNRTLTGILPYVEKTIAGSEAWPPDLSAASEYLVRYFKTPRLRNPLGVLILRIATPDYSRAVEAAFGHKVRSELLWVYLNKRLGQEVTMNDPFAGAPYAFDADGTPFCVGRDRKAGTPDDVRFAAGLKP